LPTDFQLFSDNDYYAIKDKIDDSYTVLRDHNKKQRICINRDNLYQMIATKYPTIDNGFTYEEFIKNEISMRPDLHAIHIVNDTMSVGLVTVFFLDYYDSTNTMTYMAKRERFLVMFTRGKIRKLFHLDETELKLKGLGINEIGSFAMDGRNVWFTTYVRQDGGISTADNKLARYLFAGDALFLDSVLQLQAPNAAHNSHPAFYNATLVSTSDYMAIRHYNKIYDKSGKMLFALPIDDSLMQNNDPYKVNFGITSMAQIGDSIAVLYFAGGVRRCTVVAKSTGIFTQVALPTSMLQNATLVVSDKHLSVVYYNAELKSLEIRAIL
jgi:hypothetical protein